MKPALALAIAIGLGGLNASADVVVQVPQNDVGVASVLTDETELATVASRAKLEVRVDSFAPVGLSTAFSQLSGPVRVTREFEWALVPRLRGNYQFAPFSDSFLGVFRLELGASFATFARLAEMPFGAGVARGEQRVYLLGAPAGLRWRSARPMARPAGTSLHVESALSVTPLLAVVPASLLGDSETVGGVIGELELALALSRLPANLEASLGLSAGLGTLWPSDTSKPSSPIRSVSLTAAVRLPVP